MTFGLIINSLIHTQSHTHKPWIRPPMQRESASLMKTFTAASTQIKSSGRMDPKHGSHWSRTTKKKRKKKCPGAKGSRLQRRLSLCNPTDWISGLWETLYSRFRWRKQTLPHVWSGEVLIPQCRLLWLPGSVCVCVHVCALWLLPVAKNVIRQSKHSIRATNGVHSQKQLSALAGRKTHCAMASDRWRRCSDSLFIFLHRYSDALTQPSLLDFLQVLSLSPSTCSSPS